MNGFIEQLIIDAVRELLTGLVNELLGDFEFHIPLIEFSNYSGINSIVPLISLSSCERTEKERIIKHDAYSLTINFCFPETPESEIFCYAYASVITKVFEDNPTLIGIADRALITGKKYNFPKKPNCGQEYELIINTRISIEGINHGS